MLEVVCHLIRRQMENVRSCVPSEKTSDGKCLKLCAIWEDLRSKMLEVVCYLRRRQIENVKSCVPSEKTSDRKC